MKTLISFWRGLRSLTQRRAAKQEIDEELRFHLERRTAENIAAGMSPDQAARAARKRFGNMQSVREECRDTKGTSFGEATLQDLRFASRQFVKNPGFVAVAVVTLALGIGANTAIFSVIDAVLLKPLPYHDPGKLVVVWADNPAFNLGIHELPPSQLDLLDWRRRASSFQQFAGFESTSEDLSRNGESTRIGAVAVTASFFSTMGLQPVKGRGFTAEEEQPGKDKVVVISDGLWRREFGKDPNLIGQTITLNNENRVVVGIMPPGFNFPLSAEMPAPYDLPARSDLWLPVAGDAKFWQDDVNRQFIVIGRLKAGVDILQAQSEMDLIAQQVAKERPSTHAGWSTHLQSLTSQVTGQTRPVLLVLLAAVAFVLLIACANVASLLLCRSAARRKEMAIRAAMGAGRMRVIRQLLTESVLLALLGGGAGMLLSAGGLKILLALSPPNIPRLRETAIDGRVLIASLTLSFIAAVLFGLVPALHASKVSLSGALNAGGRGNSDGGSRRSLTGLVIAQVAVAFTLLVGAALLVQSFQRLLALDPGFAKTGVCAFDLTFRGKRYESDDAKIAFFRRVQEQFRALPGVHSLAAISHLPLGGSENVSYFLVEGLASTPQGHEPVGEERVVTPGYFQVMGVKLVDGRDFDTFDTRDKPLVAIVNQTLAQQFFPGGNAIGKRIRMRDYREHDWFTIVGIVRDVRATALELKPLPGFFLAYSQAADSFGDMTVVVRGTEGGLHLGIESGLRREMNAIDPAMPVANFRTMEELVSTAVSRPKFGSFLLSLFAATALTLTIIGLYGVVAYTVSQRLRELGIRLVLGATRGEILRMVLAQGMWPALAGLVLGLCAAMGLGRFLASLLFEIHATDPVTLVVASMILVGITALACWIPARRATRVDLMVALRHE